MRGADSTITVFLLDDHELARRGVRRIIETDERLEVIGEAETGHDAIALVPHLSPDVAVLDLSLPDMTGVEVCREICANHPETRCLILTSFDDDRAMLSAVMAGAAGYVLKEIKGRGLLDAIHRVATGETLISERAARATVNERLSGLTMHHCGSSRARSAACSTASARGRRTARSPRRWDSCPRPSRTTSPTCLPNWAWHVAPRRPRTSHGCTNARMWARDDEVEDTATAPVARVVLADGRRVTIRPLEIDDEAALRAAIQHADPDTIYWRFMGAAPPFRILADAIQEMDYVTTLALVAVDPRGRIVAVAEYHGSPGSAVAELALVVAPGWRRVGLGTKLVVQLGEAALERGVTGFTAFVLERQRSGGGVR